MQSDFEYDIGLIYRSNHNYGANMTHYALYSVLTEWGYRVAMIDLPEDSPYYLPITRFNPYELYFNIPYNENSIRFRFKHKWDLLQMNKICRLFVVGSDQLWRNYFVKGTDYFSTLDWVTLEKFKMSYSTSFGVAEFEGNEADEKALAQRLARFDAISVREQSGIEIIKKMIHKEAVCVADPVFLCPKEKYYELAERGKNRLPREKYIAAYILDRSDEKDSLIKKVGACLGNNKYVLIEDAMVEHEYQKNDEMNPLQEAKNEEWLAMIQNCEVLVTDSFHGTCFAIIFGKQFLVMTSPNHYRGYSRIESLLKMLGLEKCIISDMKNINESVVWDNKINYQEVYCKLENYIYQSKKWLTDRIYEAMGKCLTVNRCADENNVFINNLVEEKRKFDSYLLSVKKKNEHILKFGDKVAVWGTGNCFKQNIKLVNENYTISDIVDSNADKWGKKYLNGIRCISPEELMKKRECRTIIIMIENMKAIEEVKKKLEKNYICVTYEELYGKR